MVYLYPEPGYKGAATTQQINCNGALPLAGIKSYTLKQIEPGVYFFSTCNDWNSVRGPFTTSQNDVSSLKDPEYDVNTAPYKFSGKVACIKIVDRPASNIFYGALPHEGTNYQGKCSFVLEDSMYTSSGVFIPMGVIPNPASFTIVQIIKNSTAGDGIVLSSDSDFHGGFRKIPGSSILTQQGHFYVVVVNNVGSVVVPFDAPTWYALINQSFDYTGVNVPDPVKQTCDKLIKAGQVNSCAGSVKNNGIYLLVVHGLKTGENVSSCTVFPIGVNIENLASTPALSPGAGGKLFYIEVVAAASM